MRYDTKRLQKMEVKTMTLTELRVNAYRAKARRERTRRLRAELESFRTPAERAELDAILARHETNLAEVLRAA